MKLRVRFGSVTKILTLQDNPNHLLGHIKLLIKEEFSTDFNLRPEANFDLTLDGYTNLGRDFMTLSSVGVVHGDLIKIINVISCNEEDTFYDEDSSIAKTQQYIEELSVNEDSIIDVEHEAISRIDATDGKEQASTSSNHSVHEGPLLLHDYLNGQALPSTLHTLYELKAVKDYFHALCAVIHNLMLESGFILQLTPSMQHPLDISNALSTFAVILEYNHPAAQSVVFSLNCTVLSTYVLFNGLVHHGESINEQVLSFRIKADEYVKKFDSKQKPSDEKTVYKNLPKLSRLFKENIAYKALDIMREELHLLPLRGLLSLFPEILLRIFSSLDASSLCSVSQTCHRLLEIADDNLLWQPLYISEFGLTATNNISTWKDLYKRKYLQMKKEQKERAQRELEFAYSPFNPYPTVPVAHPGQQSIPVPFSRQPAGMLGGNYDLEPHFTFGPFGGIGHGLIPSHPFSQNRPRLPGSGNPLPGSRYDPMHPNNGRFRPGRGGGMMDQSNI